MLKHLLVPALCLAACVSTRAQYTPKPVTVPDTASYLTRTGEVQIIGNDGWDAVINAFDALFLKTHPNFGRTFHPILKGSSIAIPNLEAGTSAFAPMGRALWETDAASFRRFYGYDPLDIRIGYDAFGPRDKRKSPPGIYVHASNPLAGLTVEQIQRVLTEGSPQGDLSHWSQLGLKGKYATRAIHVYGLDPASGGSASFRAEFLDNRPFTSRFEALPRPADVLKALAEDPFGIALLGFADAASISPDLRMLPVATKPGQPFLLPTYDVVHADQYPFPAYLHIYVNRKPNEPLDPFLQEYLRMVLSPEGQAILASQRDTEEGYVPLAPALLPTELKKLD
jgi:phosphate transport system substrate-binding protein